MPKATAEAIGRYREEIQSTCQSTVARCPKCDRYHKTWINWTGHGIPRIYCHDCKHTGRIDQYEYYECHGGAHLSRRLRATVSIGG
jgi:hypothetical protein